MSNSSIMSVRELIDSAFGEEEKNVVHFKIIQTVLYLLARQLRVLERRVQVVIPPDYVQSTTSLSVTEINMQASVPKKKKRFAKSEGQQSIAVKKQMPTATPSISKKSVSQAIKSAADVSQDTKVGEPGTAERSVTKSKKLEKGQDVTQESTTESSAAEKTATDKSSSLKSSTMDKSSSSKAQTTTDKTTSSTKSSSSRTPTQKASSKKSTTITEEPASDQIITDVPSIELHTTGIIPTEKNAIKSTKTGKSTISSKVPDGTTASSKTTSDKTAEDTTTTSTSGKSTSKSTTKTTTITSKPSSLDNEQKKRKFSREESYLSPTPMASIDSMEVQYEKLLIVERLPSGEGKPPERVQRLSVVTQEQFLELTAAVQRLETKFGPISTPGFVENAKLMEELRRGASLTDAMAALQLSARVEAAEKTLEQMLSLITELVEKTPGIDDTKSTKTGTKSKVGMKNRNTQNLIEQDIETGLTNNLDYDNVQGIPGSGTKEKRYTESKASKPATPFPPETIETKLETSLVTQETQGAPYWITIDELDEAMEQLYGNVIKAVTAITTRSSNNADTALKTVSKLESKLTSSLNLDSRMEEVENLIAEYAEHVNALDTNLASQMTNYQEQITQMQYDLDTSLETMAESLANSGGDSNAVAELNSNFTRLQMNFDNATIRQRELQDTQHDLAIDLQDLWKQIENLRDIKSDRDEVADALKDKVGIGALNGILSQTQFDAVRGDFEKQIVAAYDKFNNQEFIWQKAIDDLLRHLNEKADLLQVVALRDDINKHLEKLRNKVNTMLDIVGEPRTAALTRKLNRDGTCLSCSSPAHMALDEPTTVPALPPLGGPRPPTIGAESIETTKGDTDGFCYPGYPVPHLLDPRTHFCKRYCGGSHTLLPSTTVRVPAGIVVTTVENKNTTTLGTDGKMYLVDEQHKKKPCAACNRQKPASICTQPMEAETAPKQDYDMNLLEYQFLTANVPNVGVSLTPPFILED